MEPGSDLEKKVIRSSFDPDFEPSHPKNQEAAAARGLRYDRSRKQYVDREGYVTRDRYGQPLG